MSSQKGNVKKSRQQKHPNTSVFKNTKHYVSDTLKFLNNMQITGVCQHCKDKIEWKIKYKKYKPLTAPRRCTKCGEKSVKRAYYILCTPCATTNEVCAMCTQKEPVVLRPGLDPDALASEKSRLENDMKLMSERERRTFLRKNLGELESKRTRKLSRSEDDDDDDDNNIESDDDNIESDDASDADVKLDLENKTLSVKKVTFNELKACDATSDNIGSLDELKLIDSNKHTMASDQLKTSNKI